MSSSSHWAFMQAFYNDLCRPPSKGHLLSKATLPVNFLKCLLPGKRKTLLKLSINSVRSLIELYRSRSFQLPCSDTYRDVHTECRLLYKLFMINVLAVLYHKVLRVKKQWMNCLFNYTDFTVGLWDQPNSIVSRRIKSDLNDVSI